MDWKIIFLDADEWWQTTTYINCAVVMIFLKALKPNGGMKKHQRECAEPENTVSYLYCGAQGGTC